MPGRLQRAARCSQTPSLARPLHACLLAVRAYQITLLMLIAAPASLGWTEGCGRCAPKLFSPQLTHEQNERAETTFTMHWRWQPPPAGCQSTPAWIPLRLVHCPKLAECYQRSSIRYNACNVHRGQGSNKATSLGRAMPRSHQKWCSRGAAGCRPASPQVWLIFQASLQLSSMLRLHASSYVLQLHPQVLLQLQLVSREGGEDA